MFLCRWKQDPSCLEIPHYSPPFLLDFYAKDDILDAATPAYEALTVQIFHQLDKLCDLLETLEQPSMRTSLAALNQLNGMYLHKLLSEYHSQAEEDS